MKTFTMKRVGSEEVIFRVNYSLYEGKAIKAAQDLQIALGLDGVGCELKDDGEFILWVDKK